LVTGATGTGKSTLLSTLAAQRKMTVIDPFGGGAKTWAAPEVGLRGGVVIDHIHYLKNAKAVVVAAAAWCDQHAVPLWLCDICCIGVESKGITVPRDTIELHLDLESDAREQGTTPVAGRRIVVHRDRALALAQRIAVTG
jgi:energy-coupling factor transporter ATP-binding protein EcfA2